MRHGWMLCLAVAAAALVAPAAASAASVAYIDNGNVWVSSLDGTQKKQLTGDGFWREVAQSDGGRIVGVRRLDGQSARLATIALWEANGSKAFDGFLPAPGGWQLYAYPLSVDVSADGKFLVYGYSNSSYNPALFPNPYTFERGHYLMGLLHEWVTHDLAYPSGGLEGCVLCLPHIPESSVRTSCGSPAPARTV